MQRFFETLQKTPKKVEYGLEAVKKKLEMSAVDIVLVSESLNDKDSEEIEEICEKFGSTFKVVSTETREGVQLQKMGKIAALLRYEVH